MPAATIVSYGGGRFLQAISERRAGMQCLRTVGGGRGRGGAPHRWKGRNRVQRRKALRGLA
jgi:hypothetical protein